MKNKDEEIKDEINEEVIELIEVNPEEVMDSIKLNDVEVEVKPKKTRAKKDKPTPEESKNLTEKETVGLVDDETKDLYNEFRSFLEVKSDIKEEVNDTKQVIPTGIDLLDAMMGGGFAVGGLNITIGTPGSGKSMLSMQALAGCQKKYEDPICSFLDSEQSTTAIRLASLGVTNPKIRPYGEMTVEKVFKFLEGLCLFKEQKGIIDTPSAVVWDSIANTLSQKEIEADDPKQVIGYKARLLSLLIPKYIAKASKYNIAILAINQLRDNVDMGQFSPPADLKFMSHTKTMPGGQAIKFNAFQLLEMKHAGALDAEKYGINGIKAKIKTVKNKLFTPNIEVELLGDFVRGFSNFHTNYNLLVNTNRLKTGAWNYLVEYPTKKFRTKDALDTYINDEAFKKAYDESVKDAINTEIIDKYTIDAV